MKKVRITVMKMGCYPDLMAEYENPMEHPCDMVLGQVFVADGWNRPEGLCLSAWESMSPFVLALASGGENLYAGWMKNPRSAMISCNDAANTHRPTQGMMLVAIPAARPAPSATRPMTHGIRMAPPRRSLPLPLRLRG